MAVLDIEAIRGQVRALDFVRGTPAEHAMWREDDADSRANLAIEGMALEPDEEALFDGGIARKDRARVSTRHAPALELPRQHAALLPGAVPAFVDAVILGIQHAPAVSQQVRDGDVDIGVALAAAPAPGVQVLFRTGVDLRAVCAPRHAIASRKSVPLAELQRHQIALPVSTTDARRVFDAACALEGVVIEPVLTANMFAVLVAFVLAGDAVSIMSEVSVRGRVESGQLVAIPIRSSHNLMRCIEIQVMAGRRLPDVAQKFIELLIAELERAV